MSRYNLFESSVSEKGKFNILVIIMLVPEENNQPDIQMWLNTNRSPFHLSICLYIYLSIYLIYIYIYIYKDINIFIVF